MGSRCPPRAERRARTIHPSSGTAQNYKHIELLQQRSKLWHSSTNSNHHLTQITRILQTNHRDKIVKQPHGTRVHAIFWQLDEKERDDIQKNIYQNVSVFWTALFDCLRECVRACLCVWGWASLFLDRGKSRRGIRQCDVCMKPWPRDAWPTVMFREPVSDLPLSVWLIPFALRSAGPQKGAQTKLASIQTINKHIQMCTCGLDVHL